jgi:hypothetical protein
MESFVENVRLARLCAAIPKNEQLIADSCYGSPEMRKRFTAVTSIKSRGLCAPGQKERL